MTLTFELDLERLRELQDEQACSIHKSSSSEVIIWRDILTHTHMPNRLLYCLI